MCVAVYHLCVFCCCSVHTSENQRKNSDDKKGDYYNVFIPYLIDDKTQL